MAGSQFLNTKSVSITDGNTLFLPVAGDLGALAETLGGEIPIRDAGVFSRAYAYIPTNTASVSSTVTLRISQADTAIVIAIGSDQTGVKENLGNAATAAATDEVCWEVTVPSEAGSNTLTLQVLGIEFSPITSTDCIQKLSIGIGFSDATANRKDYNVPNGQGRVGVTEANAKYRVRATFTSSDLYTWCTANTRDDDTVLSTRKNGGAGGQTVTYTTTQTGGKEDTGGSDSLVAGDDFCYEMVIGAGAGSITMSQMSTTCLSTDNIFPLIVSSGDGVAIAWDSTRYAGCAGDLVFDSTEANVQIFPRFTFTASELGVLVKTNTIGTDPTTVHLMDNGSPSAVTVSYAAAQTGLKNDSSNTAEITAGVDEIDYRVVTPNTSGSITFQWIGILGSTTTTATNIQINVGDTWKTANALKINIGDTWKDVVSVKQNIGDVWKDVF